MHVHVTASARMAIANDQTLWTPNPSIGYHFWSRYLDVFDEVRLLVRAQQVHQPPAGWVLASGPGVTPEPLPYYVGPAGFVWSYHSLHRALSAALARAEAVQLRVPCAIGTQVWQRLGRRRPYGVEVVGDPYDVFAPGSVQHPLRPFLRWWFPRQLRRQCRGACAIAYVTQRALQQRYPPAPAAFTTHYSSIDLPEVAVAATARRSFGQGSRFTLITVGTLAQLYKAPDVLIDAVALCLRRGFDIQLVIVGDGKHRPALEARVARAGLGGRVRFTGQLSSSAAVRVELDQADLFVLPSYQEGLPRAMIEAMARGLPCIGSTAGGIPELLSPDDMVPPGDRRALAHAISTVLTDQQRMQRMAARNLETARAYRSSVLRQRRIALYRHVRRATEAWLRQQPDIVT